MIDRNPTPVFVSHVIVCLLKINVHLCESDDSANYWTDDTLGD